jgi:hypothetical protein
MKNKIQESPTSFGKFIDYLNRLPYGPGLIAGIFGSLSFLIRIPFLIRYDLQFNGDGANCYLMTLHMAQGDHPFYLYGQDYQGTTEYYLAAWLFKLFGPSIPLVSSVSLLEWSLATVVTVYLLIQGTSKFYGIIGGCLITVGVPMTLHHSTQPFLGYPLALLQAMLVLLLAYFIVERGFSLSRFFILGLMIGSGMYLGKQFLPALPACVLGIFLFNSRDYRKMPYLRLGLVFLAGFFLGYLPEVYYRWLHPVYRDFSGIGSPFLIWHNLRSTVKSIPAYFDGQLYSRTPCTGFFTPTYYEYPRSFVDIFFSVLGLWIMVFIAKGARDFCRSKNMPLFLMSLLVLANLAAVIISASSNGNFWECRRYLYVSSTAIPAFFGVYLASLMEKKGKFWPIAAAFILVLFSGRVLLHEAQLLDIPEENQVVELKQVIAVMDRLGLKRGLGPWGEAYMIDALTNERIIVASGELDNIPGYGKLVAESDRIAIIDYVRNPAGPWRTYGGQAYRMSGPTVRCQDYLCTPYQKVKGST